MILSSEGDLLPMRLPHVRDIPPATSTRGAKLSGGTRPDPDHDRRVVMAATICRGRGRPPPRLRRWRARRRRFEELIWPFPWCLWAEARTAVACGQAFQPERREVAERVRWRSNPLCGRLRRPAAPPFRACGASTNLRAMRCAIHPGSFDPPTVTLNVIERAEAL